MLREVATEANNVNEMAKMTALNIIIKSFKVQKESSMEENALAGIIMSMQSQQTKEKKRDIHKINHQLLAAGKNVLTNPNNIKIEEKKKKKEKKQPKDIIEDQDKKDDRESKKLEPQKCINSFPNLDVMRMEEEFWKRIEINTVSFVGGSLGRYKGGITALQVSNNSRLVAIGLDSGYILVYDLVYQSKEEGIRDEGHGSPYLIRAVINLKFAVQEIEFSSDNFTQLIATFTNGTSKVYNINQHAGKIDKLKYAKKEQIMQRTIFQMEEKLHLTPNYCLSIDEERNVIPGTSYKIEKTLFFPSFTFTGIQHSYLFSCENGLIVKINSNFDLYKEQMTFGIFNKALIPIAANEEQQYPRGKYPFFKSKIPKDERVKKHIDREIFSGHRYPIIFLGFIDGSPNIVSIDQKGYLYIWIYNKASFTADVNFKPSIKLKIDLKFTFFLPEESVRIFPDRKEKEINPKNDLSPKIMEKIEVFTNNLNVPEILQNSICTIGDERTNSTQLFVPEGELPEEFGIANFTEYLFNSQNFCIRAIQRKFQAQLNSSRIIGAKMSKDQKYIVIHLVKDHFLSIKGRENHEFVVIRIMGQRLNIFKATLDFAFRSNIVFEISSEIPPFNIPYLYVVKGNHMLVVSLITGQTLKRLNFNELIKTHINTTHSKRDIIFDKIVSHNYKYLFLASKKFDTVLLLKLQNSMESTEVESYSVFGKILNE